MESHTPHERKMCGARTKQSDDHHPCRRFPTPGMKRCKLHGGKSLVGMGNPAFRDGRHSSILPLRFQGAYQKSINDSNTLSIQPEIGLIDARLCDLLQHVDHTAGSEQWATLRDAWERFKYFSNQGEADKMRAQIVTIGQIIERGVRDFAVWHDIMNLIEKRRRLVDTEQKRLVNMSQMMTYERAAVLFGFITEVIKRHVHDRNALSAISAEFRTITAGDDDIPVRPAVG